MYTPDIERFKNGNIGLTFDIEKDCGAVIAETIPMVVEMLTEIKDDLFYSKKERTEFYKKYYKEFWNGTAASYSQIWTDMKKKAQIQ